MIAIDLRVVRQWTTVAVLVVLAARLDAAAVVDTTNDVGTVASSHDLRPNYFWAQSFTVTTDGLLSQVDVQVGKFAGATGDVEFELRPLVGGLPTIWDRERLFATTIPIGSIPVINALADPAPFVTVDVSAAGLHVKPGDVYAISMRRSGGTPEAAWRAKTNTYAGGTGHYRPYLDYPWEPTTLDFGFRTWVDSTPTAPYKLIVDPTFDVTYAPGATTSTLTEGESGIIVSGTPARQPLLEFPIDDLPAGAVIGDAHLEFDFYGSSGAPRLEVMGYAGDGIASFPDATAAGTLLATLGPTSASSSGVVPIGTAFVESLVGEASHLGVRLRGLDGVQYVAFTALESHLSINPTRLVIEYTLPQTLAGDFNDDGKVDGLDYTVWRNNMGDETESDIHNAGDGQGGVNDGDFGVWKLHYDESDSPGSGGNAAVPEPASLLLACWVFALALGKRRKTRENVSC